tara:strand:+ start:25 stop:465 length:441 start_codon:yes stop_codon:yes gene_type:complete
MGLNSTEVAYQFGQFGSTFLEGDGAILNLSGSDPASVMYAKYYVCAITFLEDTQFGGSGLGILDGGPDLGLGKTHFASNEDTQTLDTNWGAETNQGDNDSDLIVLDASGTVFPKGITLYGMYDYVELHSGSVICYVAPRPDYRDRA